MGGHPRASCVPVGEQEVRRGWVVIGDCYHVELSEGGLRRAFTIREVGNALGADYADHNGPGNIRRR